MADFMYTVILVVLNYTNERGENYEKKMVVSFCNVLS